MPVKYYSLGYLKRLNQIVMAGSHDAGITAGRHNVKTQQYDIYNQALKGVRIFDIRITRAGQKGHKELKTYHGSPKDPTEKHKTGAWGEGLTRILNQAADFVTNQAFRDEFLILKFDKSSPWDGIATECVNVLGTNGRDVLYTAGGNLNRQFLYDLRGKVIVLFMQEGFNKLSANVRQTSGILPIRKAPEDAAYNPNYNGMQYCGKGGTDWNSNGTYQQKIDENYGKQRTRFRAGLEAGGNPDVMGMVYWTTTGFTESIKHRNQAMWDVNQPHRPRLQRMFQECLGESIQDRLPRNVNPAQHAFGAVLKVYMPNFVLVDFADDDKCQHIYDLNAVASTDMTQAFQALDNQVRQQQRAQRHVTFA
jgi:hypothetical protein